MRVALAGCRAVGTWPEASVAGEDVRPWEADDRSLHQALRRRDAFVATPSWDDPAVDWSAFDAVLVRTTWDYHHHRDAFVAWADRVSAVTRLFNPADVLRWNSVKTYLRDLDVPQVDTVWLDTPGPLGPTLRDRGWRRAFLKPSVGATAEGTLRFDVTSDGIAEAEAHAQIGLRRGTMLLQPYVETVETLGERSAVVIDGEVSHWVHKIPLPGDYRVQDDYGAADRPLSPDAAERALVDALLPRLAGLLYGRVDWLIDGEGQPRLVELELIEPSLFFRHGPSAGDRLAEALLSRL